MMKHLFKNLSLVSVLIFMSTSCSTESQIDALNDNDLNLNVDITDDESNVQGLSFRDKWLESDELAIEVNGDVKKYKIADTSTGKILPSSGVEPFYFQSGSALTVNAWWPYSATPYTSWSVEADQSSGNAMLQSDLIMATAPQVAFASSASLNFEHLTANVLVHVINKDAVNDKNKGDIKVSFGQSDAPIKLDGKLKNGALTVNGDGATAVVTPKDVTDAESGYAKSVAALLIPQTLNTNFITVTLGEKVYQTKLSDEVTLEAGKSNVFNVTVKKDYLEVEKVSATDWNKGTEVNVDMLEFVRLGPRDFKVLDYVYTDGTYSDGGFRLYSTGKRDLDTSVKPTSGKTLLGRVIVTDKQRLLQSQNTIFTGCIKPDALVLTNVRKFSRNSYSWSNGSSEMQRINTLSPLYCYYDINGLYYTKCELFENKINPFFKHIKDRGNWGAPGIYSSEFIPSIGQYMTMMQDICGVPSLFELKDIDFKITDKKEYFNLYYSKKVTPELITFLRSDDFLCSGGYFVTTSEYDKLHMRTFGLYTDHYMIRKEKKMNITNTMNLGVCVYFKKK